MGTASFRAELALGCAKSIAASKLAG